jgi:hypothetical protein
MVEDDIDYEYKCPDCNWNIQESEIKNRSGYKEQIFFWEQCGARLIKCSINEFDGEIEIEQKQDENSKLFPVEIIATDPDFVKGFIDNLTLVISRMIYVNIRILEKTQHIDIDNIKFDVKLLNFLADTIMPILDREINLLFLKSLLNLTQEDFDINLKKLQSKLANIHIYRQYFIIYFRWLIKEIFTIVSELSNKKNLEVFDKTIINDLKEYNFEEIYLLLANPDSNEEFPKDASHSLLSYLNDFFSKFPEEISNYKSIDQLNLKYHLDNDKITDIIIGYLSEIYNNAMVMDIYNLLWTNESDKKVQLINHLSSQLEKYPEQLEDIESARQLALNNGFGTAGSKRDQVRNIIKQYLRIRYGFNDAEIMYNEIWGSRCKQTKALDYENLKDIIKEKDAILLTTKEEYDRMTEPPVLRTVSIEHITKRNTIHRFDKRINSFLYDGTWCPVCTVYNKIFAHGVEPIEINYKNLQKIEKLNSLKNYILTCEIIPKEVLQNQGERISNFARQFTSIQTPIKRDFINKMLKNDIKYYKQGDKNVHYALLQLVDFSNDKHFNPSQIYYCHGSADHASVLSKILNESDYAIASEIPIYREYNKKFLIGHIDVLLVIDDFIYVCDYKPRTSPHPNANPCMSFINSVPQVASYGLVIKRKLKLDKVLCISFNKLGAWIYEPKEVLDKITKFIKKENPKKNLSWEILID